jgi:hypothetical protein
MAFVKHCIFGKSSLKYRTKILNPRTAGLTLPFLFANMWII